jgi:TonB-linked SusC/RagA family outer membrane protein
VIGNISFDYKFASWLSFRSFYGLDYRILQGKSYRDPRTPDVFARKGLGQVQSNWNTNVSTYQTLNFNQTFGSSHKIDGLIGAEYKKENNEGINTSAEGFPTFQFTTLNTAATPLSAGEFFSGFRQAGYFTTVNYSYANRYLISGILRYDYSSRFGRNNRWGWFPGVKLAWNIDRENFLSASRTISQLKLRASYGVAGNDQIGNFDALGLYGGGPVYNGSAGITFTQLENPDLKWEKVKTSNIGIDLGLFNNRISATIEVYRKSTSDALLNLPVQWTTGFSQITSNVGKLENKGIELTLGGDVLRPKVANGLRWNTNFVFTYNKNTVKELYGGLDELPGDQSTHVGRTIGSVFTYRYQGVNVATGRPMWLDSTGNLTYQVQARDRVYIGDNQPDYWGGWSNTISYRGFTLDVFFNYEYGRLAQDGQVLFLTENLARLNELQVVYNERWTTPGQVTSWPRMNVNGSESKGSGAQTGDRSWFKADYIRLKNVMISYDIPASVYNRLRLNNARFYVQGTNLWTYDDSRSYDVEFFGASTGIIPQSKNITVGLQIGF